MRSRLIFDHIGIVVGNIQEGEVFYSSLLPIVKISNLISDKALGVHIKFLEDSSGLRYELISPFGENSPISSALRSRKNIINHIAYKSTDYDNSIKDFLANGCTLLGPPQRALAFDKKRVCFFLTKLFSIIELIES